MRSFLLQLAGRSFWVTWYSLKKYFFSVVLKKMSLISHLLIRNCKSWSVSDYILCVFCKLFHLRPALGLARFLSVHASRVPKGIWKVTMRTWDASLVFHPPWRAGLPQRGGSLPGVLSPVFPGQSLSRKLRLHPRLHPRPRLHPCRSPPRRSQRRRFWGLTMRSRRIPQITVKVSAAHQCWWG